MPAIGVAGASVQSTRNDASPPTTVSRRAATPPCDGGTATSASAVAATIVVAAPAEGTRTYVAVSVAPPGGYGPDHSSRAPGTSDARVTTASAGTAAASA